MIDTPEIPEPAHYPPFEPAISTPMRAAPCMINLFAVLLLLSMALPLIANAGDPQERFPFGVFDKSDAEGKFEARNPVITGSKKWEEYRTKMLDVFNRYNINTVINTPYLNDSHARHVLDQLHEHDIDVIFQPRHPFNRKTEVSVPGDAPDSLYRHPSIVAIKIMDEPKTMAKLQKMKRWYKVIENHYDFPIITAFIGESMGTPNSAYLAHRKKGYARKNKVYKPIKDFELIGWNLLETKIRFARHYPIRRQYDLVNWYQDKMTMPFHEWCAYMESVSNTPWWYIPQLLGKGTQKSKSSYWRIPTAAEMNAMIHTALANGARGIIGWGIPSYDVVRKPTRQLLIDENLVPVKARDGSIPMQRYGEIGALVQQHADLLLSHTRSGLEISKDNDEVIAIPREDKRNGKGYIYSVNLNGDEENSVELSFVSDSDIETVTDIYTDNYYPVRRLGDSREVTLTLAPGQAVFLSLDER